MMNRRSRPSLFPSPPGASVADFGAVDDGQIGIVSIDAGSRTPTIVSGRIAGLPAPALTEAMKGQSVRIRGAGADGADLATTVAGAGRLSNAAATAVTNVPMHVGTDNKTAFRKWMAEGGGHIPATAPERWFLIEHPETIYPAGATWRQQPGAKVLIGSEPGGAAAGQGFSLRGKAVSWGAAFAPNRTFQEGFTAVCGPGSEILTSPAHSTINEAQSIKGPGITNTRGFTWNGGHIHGDGPGAHLFTLQFQNAFDGQVNDVRLGHWKTGRQGADMIHWIADNADIVVRRPSGRSADDCISFTHELGGANGRTVGCVQERIHVVGPSIVTTDGHSWLKALITSAHGTAAIRDILIEEMHGVCLQSIGGAGLPIYIQNNSHASGARIERFTVRGGSTRHIPHPGALDAQRRSTVGYGGTIVSASDADDITFENHLFVQGNRPRLLTASNCRRLKLRRVTNRPGERCVIEPAGGPLISLKNCPDHDIDTGGLVSLYPGQPILMVDGVVKVGPTR